MTVQRPVKAIIFDLDGTVLDTGEMYFSACMTYRE